MFEEIDIPRLLPVRQQFPRPRESDLAAAVDRELSRVFVGQSVAGARIAVTVGSRGIVGIGEITRHVVAWLKAQGADPFIIPAMGSHGGAKPEGQAALLAHYGVTEADVGAPIESAMETRKIGRSDEGVDVFLAETACRADGVLLMNRIKPHTDYKGPIESGLSKICAIGLGKLDGARECHSHIFGMGLGAAISSAARHVVASGRVFGGLAILENAYHETARLVGVPLQGFFEREAETLREAFSLMGRLPILDIDALWCGRLGKNISGAGMDTNIIGRGVYGYICGEPWREGQPSITRIIVSDLSEESDGNATGMGLAEFTTRRFESKIDRATTSLNCITSNAPVGARMPIVLDNDRDALRAALSSCERRPGGPLVVCIRDTLSLEHVWVSEACRPLLEGREDVQVLAEPVAPSFDADGYLQISFDAGAAN